MAYTTALASVTPPKLRGSSHECNERATRVQMPLMPRSRRQKGRGKMRAQPASSRAALQKRSAKRLLRADRVRCGERRLPSRHRKPELCRVCQGRRPADRRPCEAIAAVCTLVKTLLSHIGRPSNSGCNRYRADKNCSTAGVLQKITARAVQRQAHAASAAQQRWRPPRPRPRSRPR